MRTTQLDDVFVVEMVKADTIDKVHQMPQLNVREIDMQQNTGMALDYLSYQLQRQIEAAQQVAGARICKQQQEVWDSTPVQVQPGLFTSTHCDMIYKFKCPNLTARILELEDCWNDIPIQGGGFVIPHNKLFTPHSSNLACSKFFPLTVQITEGWVALMPYLLRQSEPPQLPSDRLWKAESEEYSAAGLYSEKEFDEWRGKMLFPSYKKATLGEVAYGNCLAVGECAATGADNIPVYSLAKLSPGILNLLGMWAKFRTWLRELGNVMALFCILIFIGTTAGNLTTIIVAAVKAGPEAAADVGRRIY
ncbi:MAG: hypothetical protein GY696_02230, partial [Gammaproteobacteria bacterium]|nr:hypothetical protein [Gammaproteobacteria bacterium]